MGEYHYLGEGHSAGDTMRMVAERDGEWVGLLMWGSACYRLKPRDEFIGWTATQRANRQKLVVQNRRFALLAERGQQPNLASHILGAAIRELPTLWFDLFGYEPLLAETFTDIEAFEGTCYRASGWQPLGKTKGYSRDRADFYVPNDRPKKLWVRELRRDAAGLLRAMELPGECGKGAQSDADGVLPLQKKQIESLHEALCRMPDPRARNRTFHIGAILTIIAMAIFSGHQNLVQIVRFANRLRNDQRKDLGLPRFKPDSSYRKVPSYKVFYNLLRKIDIDAFAQSLSRWLAEHSGTLPTALALDGKFIRNTVGVVCLVDHDNGVPRAMAKASKKEGEGKDRLPGYYLSSALADSMSPEQWLEGIRGHWGGIEIRNHWRKDACLLEDKTRSRNPNTVAAMAMLRNCLLFFLSENKHTSMLSLRTSQPIPTRPSRWSRAGSESVRLIASAS